MIIVDKNGIAKKVRIKTKKEIKPKAETLESTPSKDTYFTKVKRIQ